MKKRISDSLAALSAIAQPSSSHPLVTPIHSVLTTFTAISMLVNNSNDKGARKKNFSFIDSYLLTRSRLHVDYLV